MVAESMAPSPIVFSNSANYEMFVSNKSLKLTA